MNNPKLIDDEKLDEINTKLDEIENLVTSSVNGGSGTIDGGTLTMFFLGIKAQNEQLARYALSIIVTFNGEEGASEFIRQFELAFNTKY